MPNGKPGDTLPGDENHPVDKNMEAGFVKSVTPYIVLGLCLLGFLTNGGVYSVGLILVAFFVGWSVASGRLPYGRTLDQRREMGRRALRKLSDAQIEDVYGALKEGRKIEAIKMVRAEQSQGLAEAKAAIDLLTDLGLHWAKKTKTSG